MQIVEVKLSEIKPYENNPRNNDGAVDAVAESISQFGFKVPIVLDKDNVIVTGHTRYKAAKAMSYEKVPCIYADDLTEDQIKKFRLVDNKVGEIATWDFEKLDVELKDLDFSDYDFGFEMPEEAALEIKEDEVPEVDLAKEAKTQLGDLFQLGEHRLLCGDSTDPLNIDILMNGVKADMVFTDSPYGVNIVNDKGKVGADNLAKNGVYAPVIGDDTTETAQQAYDIYSQLCDKMILWGGNYFLDFLPPSDGWLIWDKRGESGIRNNFADGEMAWCSFHTPVRIYHQLWNGMIREGEHEKRVHPTQKPIRMLSEILQDFTNEGDIILDVFGGSGSTLIACEQTGRTCYMAELDPHYCDTIIQRWENATGKKAVKL